MRIAALSDLHLGYRRFPATVEGRNAREVDVEAAWYLAVEAVVRAQPNLITIAGDVFGAAVELGESAGLLAVVAWR